MTDLEFLDNLDTRWVDAERVVLSQAEHERVCQLGNFVSLQETEFRIYGAGAVAMIVERARTRLAERVAEVARTLTA